MSSSKQQMHSLEQFLAQAQGPSVSWADVDDDLEMFDPPEPVEPDPVQQESASSASISRAAHGREPLSLPQSPPFVVYCGNLSYNCTDRDLREFFAPLKIRDVRVAMDPHSKRSKGFGYVEFSTRDDMELAFKRSAQLLLNRPIRIDVQTSRNYESAVADRHPRRHFTGPPHTTAAAPPAERPKLTLKPRTVDVSKPSEANAPPKVNPFGSARPREEVLKEKAAAAAASSTAMEKANVVFEKANVPQAKRSNSPASSKSAIPQADSQPPHPQRSAWGPVRSCAATPSAPPASAPSSTTAKAASQRSAWGQPRASVPTSISERPLPEGNGSGHQHGDRHAGQGAQRPQSASSSGRHGAAPNTERKGPVRQQHPEHDRRSGRLPPHHNGADSKNNDSRSSSHAHRPRHRFEDRKGSRDKPEADVSRPDTVDAPATVQRARSSSPSHAAVADDDAGFEVQRGKGRRNGSGRSGASLSSTLSKLELGSVRKDKGPTSSKASTRSSAPAEIPSSLSYSTNLFSMLRDEED